MFCRRGRSSPAADYGETMITLDHVCKTFVGTDGQVEALKDVTLTVPDGDIYGIIGMSHS